MGAGGELLLPIRTDPPPPPPRVQYPCGLPSQAPISHSLTRVALTTPTSRAPKSSASTPPRPSPLSYLLTPGLYLHSEPFPPFRGPDRHQHFSQVRARSRARPLLRGVCGGGGSELVPSEQHSALAHASTLVVILGLLLFCQQEVTERTEELHQVHQKEIEALKRELSEVKRQASPRIVVASKQMDHRMQNQGRRPSADAEDICNGRCDFWC